MYFNEVFEVDKQARVPYARVIEDLIPWCPSFKRFKTDGAQRPYKPEQFLKWTDHTPARTQNGQTNWTKI